jgi:hypothetical protein
LENVAKMLPSDRKTQSSQLRAVDNVASKVELYAAECSPPLSAERLKAVKRRFTLENIQKIREALNPPDDYDLERGLWNALYYYHSSFEPSSFDELSPKQQTKKMAEVEHTAGILLSLLREQPGIISSIMDKAYLAQACQRQMGEQVDVFPLFDIEEYLERLIEGCQERKPELPKTKVGRHAEVGQREFFLKICCIHFEVTGRLASRKVYSLCYETLIGEIGEENVARIATYTNRRFKIYHSYLGYKMNNPAAGCEGSLWRNT